jgi:hypothetical protein
MVRLLKCVFLISFCLEKEFILHIFSNLANHIYIYIYIFHKQLFSNKTYLLICGIVNNRSFS